jgi:hypothetical protein
MFCLVVGLHFIINELFALIKTVSKHARTCAFYRLKLRSLSKSFCLLFFATQVACVPIARAREQSSIFSSTPAGLHLSLAAAAAAC